MSPCESLLAELARHEPADATEQRHLEAIRRLVMTGPACFSRATFEPGHLTGSAFVLDPDDRLLLHHHRRLDRWLQLGGHDEGELDMLKTALREAREESGLETLELAAAGVLDVDVHLIPSGKREPAHLHHDVRYLFRTRDPSAIRRDDAESHDLAFFPLDEASARMRDPESDRVLEKIRRIVAAGRP